MPLLNFGQAGNNLVGGALSGIGGIGGGILGALGGAAIPGADLTGVPEVAGEMAGSSAGSAAGQGLANFLTGTKTSTKGAAEAGAVGAGIGRGIGAVGKPVLGALGKFLGPKTVQGAEDVGYDPRIQTALNSSAVHNGPNGTAEKNLYSDTRNFMRTLGAQGTPEDWTKFANFGTGNPDAEAGAYLSKQLNQFAKEQSPIEEGGLLQNLQGIHVGENSSIMEPAAGDTAGKFVANELGKALKTSEDGRSVYDPSGLLQMVKNLDQRIQQNPLSKNPEANVAQNKQVEAAVLPQAKKAIEDALYERGGVNEAVSNFKVNPELEQEIRKQAPSPQAAEYVLNALNGSNTAAELRTAQAPLVRGANLARSTLNFEQGSKPLAAISKEVEAAQKLHGQNQDSTLGLLMQGKPIRAGLSSLGGIGENIGKGAQIGSQALGAKVGKAAVPALAGAGLAAGVPAGLGIPLGGAPGQPPGPGGDGTLQSLTAAGNRMQSGSDNNMSPLQQAFQDEINTQNAQQAFAEQTGGMGGSFGGSAGLGGTIAGLAPQLQRQELVANLLGGLGNIYGQAPTGLLGGIESLIPGTSANVYARQAAGTGAALGGALGISPAAGYALMPSLTQPGSAGQQFGVLGSLGGTLGQ